MFKQCYVFTGKYIENWDIRNVENMSNMFNGCIKLDCDLSNWDTSNVKYMICAFDGCKNFKGKGLENWDVSKVIDMYHMFDGCKSLKNKPSWYY